MNALEILNRQISVIEEKIQYFFKEKKLLLLAFVHRSFTNENRGHIEEHNERLEFLGDAVLNLIISEFLYTQLPEHPEGELSYLRSRMVEASTCAQYIQKIDVASFLLLGRGEAMNEGKGRNSILADLFEAIIGAIYLDGGMKNAQTFFFTHFKSSILTMIESPHRNWKAELQDFCQKQYRHPPIYTVMKEEGPDHLKIFYVSVQLEEKILGKGNGTSKKEAEQNAAKNAIDLLGC